MDFFLHVVEVEASKMAALRAYTASQAESFEEAMKEMQRRHGVSLREKDVALQEVQAELLHSRSHLEGAEQALVLSANKRVSLEVTRPSPPHKAPTLNMCCHRQEREKVKEEELEQLRVSYHRDQSALQGMSEASESREERIQALEWSLSEMQSDGEEYRREKEEQEMLLALHLDQSSAEVPHRVGTVCPPSQHSHHSMLLLQATSALEQLAQSWEAAEDEVAKLRRDLDSRSLEQDRLEKLLDRKHELLMEASKRERNSRQKQGFQSLTRLLAVEVTRRLMVWRFHAMLDLNERRVVLRQARSFLVEWRRKIKLERDRQSKAESQAELNESKKKIVALLKEKRELEESKESLTLSLDFEKKALVALRHQIRTDVYVQTQMEAEEEAATRAKIVKMEDRFRQSMQAVSLRMLVGVFYHWSCSRLRAALSMLSHNHASHSRQQEMNRLQLEKQKKKEVALRMLSRVFGAWSRGTRFGALFNLRQHHLQAHTHDAMKRSQGFAQDVVAQARQNDREIAGRMLARCASSWLVETARGCVFSLRERCLQDEREKAAVENDGLYASMEQCIKDAESTENSLRNVLADTEVAMTEALEADRELHRREMAAKDGQILQERAVVKQLQAELSRCSISLAETMGTLGEKEVELERNRQALLTPGKEESTPPAPETWSVRRPTLLVASPSEPVARKMRQALLKLDRGPMLEQRVRSWRLACLQDSASSHRAKQQLVRERIQARCRPLLSSDGLQTEEDDKPTDKPSLRDSLGVSWRSRVVIGGARARDGNPTYSHIVVTLPADAEAGTEGGDLRDCA